MAIIRKWCRNHPATIDLIGTEYCMDCGSRLEEIVVEACAYCGKRRFGRFCPWCGHEHERTTDSIVGQPQKESAGPSSGSDINMSFPSSG